jgi:stage V sporulation protein B
MGAAVYFLYPLLEDALGGKLAALAAVLFGVVVYLVILFVIRGIYREDIEMLPKGKKLANILKLR